MSSEPPDTSLLLRSSKPLDFLVPVVRPSLIFMSSCEAEPDVQVLRTTRYEPAVQVLKTTGLSRDGCEAEPAFQVLKTTGLSLASYSDPQNHGPLG
jgi:hypothetical protein